MTYTHISQDEELSKLVPGDETLKREECELKIKLAVRGQNTDINDPESTKWPVNRHVANVSQAGQCSRDHMFNFVGKNLSDEEKQKKKDSMPHTNKMQVADILWRSGGHKHRYVLLNTIHA